VAQPVPHRPASVSLPREADGFRLHRELGRGGMGVVYEAEEIASGRRIALKVLQSELVLSPEAFERFQREARLAAAISHRHCVFVYGAHEVEGSPAIAMELVGGHTLEDVIRRGEPIPIETAVRWTLDLLEGLEAAHRAGVLHRDIKPSNCFVTTDGRVKVGDFGLSRSLERDVQLTQSGQFIGSPLYASPEQIRGRAFDVRSDLYSCGATLYALLTGKSPFTGSNVGEVLARILSESPPVPSSIRPEIPRALDRVVQRAMERDPERRPRDIQALRELLAPFADTTTRTASLIRRFGGYMVDTGVMTLMNAAGVMAIQTSGLTGAHIDPEKMRFESPVFQLIMGLIPFTYFTLGEGLLGTTLGKWILGLRVIAVSQGQPSLRHAALRNVIFHGPVVLLMAAAAMFDLPTLRFTAFTTIGTIVSTILMLSTMRRRNGWRGLYEFGSGTRVVQTSFPFSRTRLAAPPPESSLEKAVDVPARLGDYAIEGVIAPTHGGRVLKGRDETLERSVWIYVTDDARALVGEARRSAARPSRLRWLGSVRTDAGASDVFESPGGASMQALTQRAHPFEWPIALRLLSSLVDEVRTMMIEDRAAVPAFACEQVWIDRHWDLRLLDHPIGRGPAEMLPSVEFVGRCARSMLVGNGADSPDLPTDLPTHAEPLVKRLLGLEAPFRSIDELHEEIVRCQALSPVLQRRTRAAQLAVNTLLPIFGVALVVVLGMVVLNMVHLTGGRRVMLEELQHETALMSPGSTEPKDRTLSTDQRRARQILIVQAFTGPWAPAFEQELTPELHAVLDEARAHEKDATPAEVAWAEGVVGAEHGEAAKRRGRDGVATPEKLIASIIVCGTLAWGVVSSVLALTLQGALTFTMFGIRVRSRRGTRASRLSNLMRCTLCWLPFFVGYACATVLLMTDRDLLAYVIGGVVAALHVAAIIHAFMNPAQNLADRLLKTRLVPR
jgi:eukaryotic-like serine/threonine-protein kinase